MRQDAGVLLNFLFSHMDTVYRFNIDLLAAGITNLKQMTRQNKRQI